MKCNLLLRLLLTITVFFSSNYTDRPQHIGIQSVAKQRQTPGNNYSNLTTNNNNNNLMVQCDVGGDGGHQIRFDYNDMTFFLIQYANDLCIQNEMKLCNLKLQ